MGNINIYIDDVKTAAIIYSMSVDIRGNTGYSSAHVMNGLIRNKVPVPAGPAKP